MVLSQEFLKENFIYDENSGLLHRIHQKGSMPAGSACGYTSVVTGYVYLKIDQKIYLAHRLIFIYMDGFAPEEVDHINHVKSDNRWINLRGVNNSINSKNRSLSKNNKSGVNGVNWCKIRNKWRARFKSHKKDISVGMFDDIEAARQAMEIKKIELGFHKNHGHPSSKI